MKTEIPNDEVSILHSSSNLEKHISGNLILKFLINKFDNKCVHILSSINFNKSLEVGCGEGYLLRFLSDKFPNKIWHGSDISHSSLVYAKNATVIKQILTCADVKNLPYKSGYFDLVIASEVLEHLEDPEQALTNLSECAGKYLLLTVPNEPIFQISNLIRGKYIKNLGNHPEHIQHWNKRGFESLLNNYGVIKYFEKSYPWLIALIEVR